MPRYELGDGQWAELRPVTDLKMKHRDLLAELANEGAPVDDDGGIDWAAIDQMKGGRPRWSVRWTRHRRNLVLAMALTGWSYDLPLPQITGDGEFLNEDSIGEADASLGRLAGPYVEHLTAEADPKEVTTSA